MERIVFSLDRRPEQKSTARVDRRQENPPKNKNARAYILRQLQNRNLGGCVRQKWWRRKILGRAHSTDTPHEPAGPPVD
jgi:hypothetical protein